VTDSAWHWVTLSDSEWLAVTLNDFGVTLSDSQVTLEWPLSDSEWVNDSKWLWVTLHDPGWPWSDSKWPRSVSEYLDWLWMTLTYSAWHWVTLELPDWEKLFQGNKKVTFLMLRSFMPWYFPTVWSRAGRQILSSP
jgi:hypothetical protein